LTKQPLTFKLRDELEYLHLSKQLFWRRSQNHCFAIYLHESAENDSGLNVFFSFPFPVLLYAS